ncbi:MAG TPA: uracil-DNA glycosylase [Bacillota bacterium]
MADLAVASALAELAAEVAGCRRCPRLVEHREAVAARPRAAYRGETYWARPVPGFGDPLARLLIIGLAPAAHGANRTGRMFTGDSSGDWLFRALHRAGFADRPSARSRDDGLTLRDCYITASCRCVPPGNRPTVDELAACRPFLERELALLGRVRVVVVLGRIAFDTYLRVRRQQGWGWPVMDDRDDGTSGAPGRGRVPGAGRDRAAGGGRKPPFGHGRVYRWGVERPVLIASYHPSRQNTNTGVLTEAMFDQVFATANRFLGR